MSPPSSLDPHGLLAAEIRALTTWSWDQQKAEGRKGAEWGGVRNFQARNNMRAMKKGDLGFFYHTGDEKRVVGIVKVVKEAHPESTDPTGQWECVDVAAVSRPAPARHAGRDQGRAQAQVHGAGAGIRACRCSR